MLKNIEKHSFKIVLLGNFLIISIYILIDIITSEEYCFNEYSNSYSISLGGCALSQIFPFVFLSILAQQALKLKSQNASLVDGTLKFESAFELETSFFRTLYNNKTIASLFTIIIAMIYVASIFISRLDQNFESIIPGIIALLLNLGCFYLIFKSKSEYINENIKPRFITGDINLN